MLHSITYNGSSFSPELWCFMVMFWCCKLDCALYMHVQPINELFTSKNDPSVIIYIYICIWLEAAIKANYYFSLVCLFSLCARGPCIFVAFGPRTIFEYSFILILLQRKPGMAMVSQLESVLPDPLRGSPITALIYSRLLPPFPSRVCSCCSHHRGQI